MIVLKKDIKILDLQTFYSKLTNNKSLYSGNESEVYSEHCNIL